MSSHVHDAGEEFEARHIFEESITKPAEVTVGLFHDGEVSGDTTNGDNLADGDNIDAISTEPTDGSYTRQTVPFDSTGFSAAFNAQNDIEATVDGGVSFDMTDTTGEVDSYFVVVNWDRDDDGTPEDNLYFTGGLEQLRDLADYTQLNVDNVGVRRT